MRAQMTPLAALALTALALALTAPALATTDDSRHDAKQKIAAPLVEKVRAATAQFRDPDVALASGYDPGPCVSGPNHGAMGVHFINTSLHRRVSCDAQSSP